MEDMDTKLPADEALRSLELFREAVSGVVLGAERPVRLLCATLLSGGHLLIEDRPGTGKTTLAKAAARALKSEFRRIQFTPDLLPGDITGGLVFLPDRSAMEFRPGPIFADVLLADELNRATPRTQAALLEAMAERQVTVDGQTHALGPHFTVFATVNPVESSGVQRLPEAELDRFLCSFSLGYPSPEAEAALIEDRRSADPLDGVEPVLDLETLGLLKERVKEVAVAPELVRYVAGLLKAVRTFVNRSKQKRIEKRMAVKEMLLELANANSIVFPADLAATIDALDDEHSEPKTVTVHGNYNDVHDNGSVGLKE